MKTEYLTAVLFFIIVFSASAFSSLMTSDEWNEYNSRMWAEYVERNNKCIWSCYGDSGIYKDADGTVHGIITINLSNVCSNKCSEDPCTQPCVNECCDAGNCTMDCIANCESACNKPKVEACKSECAGYGEGADYRWQYQECNCVCGGKYMIKGGKCLLDDGTGGDPKPDKPPVIRDSDCKCPGKCEAKETAGSYYCECPDAFISCGQCYEHSDCKSGEFCEQSSRTCKQMGNARLDVLADPKEVFLKEAFEIEVSAIIEGYESVAIDGMATNVNYIFTFTDPSRIFFSEGTHIIKSNKESLTSTAAVKIEIPKIPAEMFLSDKEDYPVNIKVNVSAEVINPESGKNFSLSGSDKIILKSPAPEIKELKITPSKVTSHTTGYSVIANLEDKDYEGLELEVWAVGVTSGTTGKLALESDSAESERKYSVAKSCSNGACRVFYFPPDFMFNPDEAVAARKLKEEGIDFLKGWALARVAGANSNVAESIGAGKLHGVATAVADYTSIDGIMGKWTDAYRMASEFETSISEKERYLRYSEYTLQSTRAIVGVIAFAADKTVEVSGLHALIPTAGEVVDLMLGSIQSYYTEAIYEERKTFADTVEINGVVVAKVTDSYGYYDIKTLNFGVQGYWVVAPDTRKDVSGDAR